MSLDYGKLTKGDAVEGLVPTGRWVRGTVVDLEPSKTRPGATIVTVHLATGHTYRYVNPGKIRRAITAQPMVPDSSVAVPVAPRAAPARALYDRCPKCGDPGEWRSMALVCRKGHGVFAG